MSYPDPADIVRIVESSDLTPVKRAQYGEVKPLIDRLRGGSPTPDECKAAADLLERVAKHLRLLTWEDFKKRVVAAYVLGLRRRPERSGRRLRTATGADKTEVAAVRVKLGRARDFVFEALSKYGDDPECQAGKFHVPADLLEDLQLALTDTDPSPMSGRPRRR
jgi:hypothetical protein